MGKKDYVGTSKNNGDGIYNNTEISKGKKIGLAVAAALLIAAAGLLFPMLLTEDEAAGSGASDGISVELPVSRYTTVSSSEPGMPIRTLCPAADEISINTDAGTFLTYSPPYYKVYEHGKHLNIKSGDTVYLSPLDEYGEISAKITVNIYAYKNSREIGRAVIVIGLTDSYYTAESISVSSS